MLFLKLLFSSLIFLCSNSFRSKSEAFNQCCLLVSDEALAKRLQEEENRMHILSQSSDVARGSATASLRQSSPSSPVKNSSNVDSGSPNLRNIMDEEAAIEASKQSYVSKLFIMHYCLYFIRNSAVLRFIPLFSFHISYYMYCLLATRISPKCCRNGGNNRHKAKKAEAARNIPGD